MHPTTWKLTASTAALLTAMSPAASAVGSSPAHRSPGSGAVAAPHALTWGPPQVVTSGRIGSPEVVVDDTGATTVVYQNDHNRVFAVQATRRGHWRTPVKLGVGRDAHIAVDAVGDATAVWTGKGFRVMAAYRPAGGSWTRARFLSPPTPGSEDVIIGAFDTDVAVNRDGDTVVAWDVWSFDDPDIAERVRARYRAAGHRWGRARTLDGATGGAGVPVVAIKPNGDAAVLYQEHGTVTAQTKAAGHGWAPPIVLAPGGYEKALDVGAGRWQAAYIDPSGLELTRQSGAGWGAPTPVANASSLAGMTAASSGDAVVAWEDAGSLWSRRVLADGTLRPAVQHADAGVDTETTSLAGNDHGQTLLAWDRSEPPRGLYASYRSDGNAWSVPLRVVRGTPTTAVYAGGDAILVWITDDGRMLARRLNTH